MNDRPTPETDAAWSRFKGYTELLQDVKDLSRKLERERDEAREALREWQTLRLWGAEPQHIHDFIKGQQARIHESQDIEKTCEQLERERDEAREENKKLIAFVESLVDALGPHTDINGSSVIPAAYAILRNIKEARK